MEKTQEIRLKVQSNIEQKNTMIVRRVIAMAMILGGMVLFCCTFSNATSLRNTLWLEVLGLSLAFGVAGYWDKSRPLVIVLDIVIAFLLFIQNASGIIRACIYVANAMIYTWNMQYQTYYQEVSITELSQNDLLGFFLILIVLLAVLIFQLTRYRQIFVMTMVVYFFVVLNVILGYANTSYCVFFLIVGWLVDWNYMASPGRVGVGGFTFIMAAVIGGVMLSIMLTGVVGNHSLVYSAREQITEGIHRIRYGEDSLTRGNLKKDINFNAGTKERLEVTMDDPTQLYFRGFIGSEYAKSSWRQLNYSRYDGENSGLLNWLNENGLVTNHQYGQFANLNNIYHDSDSSQAMNGITVDNVGADATYVYTPYAMCDMISGNSRMNQDWQYISSGLWGDRSYSYHVIGNDANLEGLEIPTWLENTSQDEVDQYLAAEMVYREFVHNTYLSIDGDTAQLMEKTFYQPQDGEGGADISLTDSLDDIETNGTDKSSIYEVTTIIRSVLEGTLTYNASPDNQNAEDYIQYVLNTSREGNSVTYATVATMAFRQADIPARYVEGYYITDEEVTEMRNAGTDSIMLTTEDAHAWVEVYMDGVGWVPIEVTPGYYQQIGSVNSYIQMSGDNNTGGAQEQDMGDQTVSVYNEGDTDEEAEDTTNHLGGFDVRIIEAIALIILIMFITVIIIIGIRGEYRARRFKRRIMESTVNESAVLLYQEIIYQINLSAPEIDMMHPMEQKEKLREHFPTISDWEYDAIVEATWYLQFAPEGINERQMVYLRKFLDVLMKENMGQLGLWQRFNMYCKWRSRVLYN